MKLRVLGIGDNVADHYTHVEMIYPGGCAYNFATYSKMLGVDAAYLGIIGDDFAGAHILRTAQAAGVDTQRCRIFHGAAPLPAVRIENGERVFIGMNSGGVWERPLVLDENDLRYVRDFQLMHTSIFSFMEQNLEMLAQTGVPLSMDFSDDFNEVFLAAHCPRLTYAVMSCRHISEQQMEHRIRQVHAFGAPNVIATRGELGAHFSDGDKIYYQVARQIQARDTMGAGDAFLTAFLLSYVEWKLQAGAAATAAERETAANAALGRASEFAAQMALVDGSFGHGTPYPVQN